MYKEVHNVSVHELYKCTLFGVYVITVASHFFKFSTRIFIVSNIRLACYLHFQFTFRSCENKC